MKYIKRKDGEGFAFKNKTIQRLACCDCGLVHDMYFIFKDGYIGIAAKRNNRATAQKRRKKK